MFSDRDKKQIEKKGIDFNTVNHQIGQFKKGFPPMVLVRPATVGDGLIQLDHKLRERFGRIYNDNQYSREKFVPASGAASRMFKSLFGFMSENLGKDNQLERMEKDPKVSQFFRQIENFAFYSSLKETMSSNGAEIKELIQQNKYAEILEFLLTEKGMNYGNLPKGLLVFHSYANGERLPLEEHFVEGAEYCSSEGKVKIHFTVSPEHRTEFSKKVDELLPRYEEKYGLKFEISFSEQKGYTDTIAVTDENELFREEDGSLLFRPAGHGALIQNLNELNSSLIFIKNIDNVVPDSLKPTTTEYKKALGGMAVELVDKIEEIVMKLEEGILPVGQGREFLRNELNTELPLDCPLDTVLEKLYRPLRICGMVINKGEAGGGPFWCKNSDGTVSLQIVESSQMNLEDPGQKKIVQKSTHFNPVDLVVVNSRPGGGNYDLRKFVDPKTGFITSKSKDGRSLKAMELPGLWNGSMSDWNTVFVEVPEITFNPVKEVNDLLRDEHRR